MLFTFLESVLQDGEFGYFWRSVQPLEEKLYEFKTIILKIVKNFKKSPILNSFLYYRTTKLTPTKVTPRTTTTLPPTTTIK